MHDHFLLRSKVAVELYERFAKRQPIVDFHCHLDPSVVARNGRHEDVVDLWIGNDPYKWRAMRINGIPERCITGNASKAEKFRAWAETLPRLAGNPLFQWSALELKRYFGIDALLNGSNAESIRERCNDVMRTTPFGMRDLLERSRVEVICTSDDWLADLSPHVATQGNGLAMLPSLRADAALAIDSPDYGHWLEALGERVGSEIQGLSGLKGSLISLLDGFDAAGCRLADHGLEQAFFCFVTEAEAERLFRRGAEGEALSREELCGLKTHLLCFLVREYAKRGWVLQLHLGAQRETSSRLLNKVGSAGGFACIGDSVSVASLCQLFDHLEGLNGLPRTVVYPLNASDFEKISSLSGSFVEEGVWGKVQLGPAWWYNDHLEGIRRQLRASANNSVLGRFIGMTTDSRSPLSMARHEYFRRALCDLIGLWVEDGTLPFDEALLEPLITDLCYRNAASLVGVNRARERAGL